MHNVQQRITENCVLITLMLVLAQLCKREVLRGKSSSYDCQLEQVSMLVIVGIVIWILLTIVPG